MSRGAAADRIDLTLIWLTPVSSDIFDVSDFSPDPSRWLTILAPSERSTFLKKDEMLDVLLPAWLRSAPTKPSEVSVPDA